MSKSPKEVKVYLGDLGAPAARADAVPTPRERWQSPDLEDDTARCTHGYATAFSRVVSDDIESGSLDEIFSSVSVGCTPAAPAVSIATGSLVRRRPAVCVACSLCSARR